MNKKLLLLGAFALSAGFFALTAFDGKTLEQQKAEIAQTITMKLDELRAAKEQECTDRVETAAQQKFQEVLAARAAEEAKKPGKKPSKPSTGKGPKPDPTPKPSGTGSESKDKWNSGQTQGSQEKWQKPAGDQSKPAQPSESKSKWQKPAGGGGK